MEKKTVYEWTIITCFLLAAAWFFFPVGKPESWSVLFAMRLVLAAIVLAVGSLWLRPKLMLMGFAFCAIGDAMGVLGSFEGQMGGFALAHICFICYFIKGIRQGKRQTVLFALTTFLCLIPLVVAVWRVIPAISYLPIRIGCSIYALLLIGTVWTAIVRAFSVQIGRRLLSLMAAIGAVSFLVSDFILAWNKFTAHIPDASLYIMSTYYGALLLLFIGTCDFSEKKQ